MNHHLTIEQAQAFAAGVMDVALNILRDGRQVLIAVHILGGDGTVNVIVLDDWNNDDGGARKAASSAFIRSKVTEHKAVAVVTVADTLTADNMTEDQYTFLRRYNMSLAEAGRFGFVKVDDTITCILETPIYSEVVRQVYERAPDGTITLGKRVSHPNAIDNGTAYLSGYFTAAGGAAQ